MADLPEYNVELGRRAAAAVELRPSEVGIEALSQGARNISRLASEQRAMDIEAGQSWDKAFKSVDVGLQDVGRIANQHQALQETNSANVAGSSILFNLTPDLKTAVASGDPNQIQQFQDKVNDQLQTLSDAPNTDAGKAHASAIADRLREHFTTALIGEQGLQAVQQTHAAVQDTMNVLSNTVAQHPETLPSALGMVDTYVDGLVKAHPNLTAEAATNLHEELAQKFKATLVIQRLDRLNSGDPDQGIAPNGAAARELLKTYGGLLPQAEQQEAFRGSQVADKAVEEQQKLTLSTEKQMEAQTGKEAFGKLLTSAFDPSTGRFNTSGNFMQQWAQAANLPGNQADPALIQSSYDFIKKLQTDPAGQHDDMTFNDMFKRSYLPQGDPQQLTLQQVMAAYGAGKLTMSEFHTFTDAVNRQNTNDHQADAPIATASMATAKAALNPINSVSGLSMMPDPVHAASNYSHWMAAAVPTVQRMVAGGKDASAAWTYVTSPEYLRYFGAKGSDNLKAAAPPSKGGLSQDQVNQMFR